MLNVVLRLLFRALLSLRYRIEVVGLDRVAPKDPRGILFLANHPALIDPFIVLCVLTERFPARAIADRKQIERPLIRWLARRVRVRGLAVDPTHSSHGSKHQVANTLRDTIRGLRAGEALLLYPAGRIYRRRCENLGNNSAVDLLVRSCPELRIVLLRTHGLWGSAFGRASGQPPTIVQALKRGAIGLLKSGILFAPRRRVRIELHEPNDFPRDAGRQAINRYLENFYNQGALPNTYVPYSIWETGGTRNLPEPDSEPPAPLSAG